MVPAAVAPGAAPALFGPLVIGGLFLGFLGLAIGLPLMLIPQALGAKIAGGVVLGLFVLIACVLMLVGLLRWQRGAAGAPAAAAARACPTCGRALLPGMATCPFCVPSAAPPPAPPTPMPMPAPMPTPPPPSPPQTIVPVAASFAPGGTMNINSANAAQQFAPGAAVAAPPRPPAGTAALQIIDGPDKGKAFQVTRAAPFTIGRAPTCSVALSDPGVSGHHAQVAFEGPALVVSDTGSRNGVFVNNQKIQRHQLSTGDLIVIGSTRLLVTV
jgi:pSer/pThr/pTyr-binding forkhead associated (FHA) protein